MTDEPTSLHAMCDPTEQMAARVRELEAENVRLRDKVQSLGTEGHAYREGKIVGMTKAKARAEAAEAELIRVRAEEDRTGVRVTAYHRSFPEAADGRPMPPMADELMTAGLNCEDARFVAIQLAQNGLRLAPYEAGPVCDVLAQLDQAHISYMRAKGRNPDEYTSRFSLAVDAIRDLPTYGDARTALAARDRATRAAAMREAAAIVDRYTEDEMLQGASGWSEEETGWWKTGGLDHLLAAHSAILARAAEIEQEGE